MRHMDTDNNTAPYFGLIPPPPSIREAMLAAELNNRIDELDRIRAAAEALEEQERQVSADIARIEHILFGY